MVSMIGAATLLHGKCLSARFGPWSVVTFVPSAKLPGPAHPTAALARQVVGHNDPHANRMTLDIGPGINAGGRSVRADRFTVPDDYLSRIRGRHVLVIDDTWISGSKVQSAAVTLKNAGASDVTALCVGRRASTVESVSP
jgi:hypothetical protein